MSGQVTTSQHCACLFERTGTQWNLRDLLSDGSTRQYARFTSENGESIIAMTLTDAEEVLQLKNSSYPWLRVRDTLARSGIKTPEVIFINQEIGTIYIEDLGDCSLEQALRMSKVPSQNWLNKSVDLAIDISCLDCNLLHPAQKSLNQDFLLRELELFKSHFVETLLGMKLNFEEEGKLFSEFQELCFEIWTGSDRTYFCHRDFHSRNILIMNNSLAVIDFQDALPGPLTYDLVSLCFDPYHPCSFGQRIAALEYGIQLISIRLGKQAELSAIKSWRATAIQRILKALSSFAKFVCIQEKTQFQHSLLPALDILLSLTDNRPAWSISRLATAARSKLSKQSNQINAL